MADYHEGHEEHEGEELENNTLDAIFPLGLVEVVQQSNLHASTHFNGTTDDAGAAQGAIDAAEAAGGGEVYFPGGSYSLESEMQSFAVVRV